MNTTYQRLAGSLRLMRMILNPNDLACTYAWIDHVRQHILDQTVGMSGMICQGIWDRYPAVSPTQRLIEILFADHPPGPGEDILDIGCGVGGLALFALDEYPHLASITGIDLLPSHIQECQRRLLGCGAAQREKVGFFVQDATRLHLATDPKLRARVAKGFDKVYIVEVTEDLSVEGFDALFRQAYNALHDDGLITMVTLTLQERPGGWGERLMADMVVRASAPTLSEINAVIARHGCSLESREITDLSTRRLGQWLINNPQNIRRGLLWPFSWLFWRYARRVLEYIDRCGYSVNILTVRKKAMK